MSTKTKAAALGAVLLAATSLGIVVAPAATAAQPSAGAAASRAETSLASPLIGGFYSSRTPLNPHRVASDSYVDGTFVSTFDQALTASSTFQVPAPGQTGTITAAGGACLTRTAGSFYVTMNTCTGSTGQTWTAVLDAGAIGVKYYSPDGRSSLIDWGVVNGRQALGLTSTNNGFSSVSFTVTSAVVDSSLRSVEITGEGIPGQTLIVNETDQVTVGADGAWSARVSGLRLGVNRVKVEAWTGGDLIGTQYADASIDVTPLTATASFGQQITDDAAISGIAERGATVIVRTASDTELGRAAADSTTGRYSIPVKAPNAAGATTLSVVQIVSGLETAPTLVSVDYGDRLAIADPIDDLIVTGGTVDFTGTGAIGARIAVTVDGKPGVLGYTTVLANGRWAIPRIAVDKSEHTFTITQTARGNNVTTEKITVNPGETGVVAPTATVSVGADPTALGTISGTGTTSGQITVTSGGLTLGPVTVQGGTWKIDVPASIGTGTHSFAVTQTVNGSNAGSTTAVGDFGAAVTATGPSASFAGDSIAVTGTGTPAARVVVTERGAQVGAANVTADGKFSAPVTNVAVGSHTYTLTQTAPGRITSTTSITVTRAAVALDLKVLDPANPAAGYTPNTAFTFSGVAKTTAGTLTIRNFTGTLVATVPVDPATGVWSWTRTNMGTSTWKLTFITQEGTADEQKVTLGDFAPNAAQALRFTNPSDPAAGYVANTAFTFRGTALPGAKIVLTNFAGVVIANVTADNTGNWSWTRTNMGTSIWKITATADKGTPRQQIVTLGDFAPRP